MYRLITALQKDVSSHACPVQQQTLQQEIAGDERNSLSSQIRHFQQGCPQAAQILTPHTQKGHSVYHTG